MEQPIKLRASDINKSFPGVKALDRINFTVRKGTVHVLCGENGAGKSTLMKIINGIYQPDSGQIYIDEQPVRIHSPIQAGSYGISMIPQELAYVPEMTVEENMFLGRWPKNRMGSVDWGKIRRQTKQLLEQEKLPFSPTARLRDLSVSNIQMLEILKAVSNKAQIIIMDEPTSAITNKEVAVLFEKIRNLKRQGVSIIYISHKLDEIFQIADDITVMRDGAVVRSAPKEEWDIDGMITTMVGRKLDSNYPKEEIAQGRCVLEAQNLSGGIFRNISFHVNEGEIVGFAGLMGAGRTEVMRALYGLDPLFSGTVKVDGKEIRIRSVKDSIRRGVVMLSEDRRRYGIVPMRSVKENTTLASLETIFKNAHLHSRLETKIVSDMFEKMQVKTPTLDTPLESLSGGNQQKVILAKWIICDPKILILDEPTRGIDVGAKYEIYKLMTQLVKQNRAIVMVSSELPELIGMCDRIYVMSQGNITGEITRDAFSQELIMKYATGILKEDVNISDHQSA